MHWLMRRIFENSTYSEDSLQLGLKLNLLWLMNDRNNIFEFRPIQNSAESEIFGQILQFLAEILVFWPNLGSYFRLKQLISAEISVSAENQNFIYLGSTFLAEIWP